jgi:hypothetical protein
MKLRSVALVGIVCVAALGLIGVGAHAVFTTSTTSRQTITAGTGWGNTADPAAPTVSITHKNTTTTTTDPTAPTVSITYPVEQTPPTGPTGPGRSPARPRRGLGRPSRAHRGGNRGHHHQPVVERVVVQRWHPVLRASHWQHDLDASPWSREPHH